jgi:tetratricopeptide (TPR) repeat protein
MAHDTVIKLVTFLTLITSPQPVMAWSQDWKALMVAGDERLKTQQYEAAEKCFRQAVLEVRHEPHSSADAQSLCLFSLAGIIQIEDRTEEVIPLYKEALQTLEKAYGKDSIKLVPGLILMGGVHETELDFKNALKCYERAVETAKAGACNNRQSRTLRLFLNLPVTIVKVVTIGTICTKTYLNLRIFS